MHKDQIPLIVQPQDGIAPLIKAIEAAARSLDILIFRFDRRDLEGALIRAVQRGVKVRALIAHISRGGERSLRALEMRLLQAGVTVSRTADDLVRYHGKMLIVDREKLYISGFNFTYLDIDRSRSFAVMLEGKFVEEAAKLFEADSARQPYIPGHANFLVSPLNARDELARFLQAAAKELIIYDPQISDPAMVRILQERAKAGVTIRGIGTSTRIAMRRLADTRLHVRLMVRDREAVFIGSQSLRGSELDKRREIGVILDDRNLADRIIRIFDKDWETALPADAAAEASVSAKKIAKRVAKAVTEELPAIGPVVQAALKEVSGTDVSAQDWEELQDTVKVAVKQAVKDVVKNAVEEGGAG
jgi:phosphatidylserine/phosphatidylglycerophosphate/cardiolipin synthase-like enzyme